MSPKKKRSDYDSLERVMAESRQREKTYRERALKMYPWICARCGRGFAGEKLRELTVHHKDHDHDNNPPDGSNWELLCLYCHENEHLRYLDPEAYGPSAGKKELPSATFQPFANLADLLNDDEKEE